jgi:hypothetical protein
VIRDLHGRVSIRSQRGRVYLDMSGTSADHKNLPNAPDDLRGAADRLPPSKRCDVRYFARKLTLMPPTGSSGPPWRWHLLSDVNAGRVRHPDGEADRRSRHKGRAAGTQARTIQLPQAPSAWIRAGDRHQPWIIGVPRTPADGHAGGTPRQNRPPLRSSKRLPGTSVSLLGITLSDGRGPGERAQSRRSVSSKAVIWLVAVATQISMFCHGEAGCEIGLRRMR